MRSDRQRENKKCIFPEKCGKTIEFQALPVKTEYWKPGEDYLDLITKKLAKRLEDGYYVVVSEKALSTASGKLIDESTVVPRLNSSFIARFWMRLVWGYLLGVVCHLQQKLLNRLRNYPREAGSRHKQIALQYAGFLQALMFGSEGGIDGSNLPYSFVSLPLNDAKEKAEEIQQEIWQKLHKHVTVMIVDTDKTYSFRNFHFSTRPGPIEGIQSSGGIVVYVIGRMLKLRKRPTPLAITGGALPLEEALKIASISDRRRGTGSGATVWDMAERFNVRVTEVSWKMLQKIEHTPMIIVRKKTN
ncbi:coenzyme F420-0:L-glutamate ligase [Candidatus Bathyarchaeota archaeon]|nr:coenzyme F420-0:L-glutamate ligase [Candidatus Bathyarchaeota archaeon]